MSALVLACGNVSTTARTPLITERDDIEVREIPSRPRKPDLDPVLADLRDRRVVVLGTDADLAAVVLRLMRAERLADVPVGYVPVDDRSPVGKLWGLPLGLSQAVDVAVRGEIDAIPLVRDDSGGVLVGRGEISNVRGVAYCDDQIALRGQASRIEVVPDVTGSNGVVVEVLRTGLLGRRRKTLHGRAFQIGCVPNVVVRDGVAHDRPVPRWTWYRHTVDLRAARGRL